MSGVGRLRARGACDAAAAHAIYALREQWPEVHWVIAGNLPGPGGFVVMHSSAPTFVETSRVISHANMCNASKAAGLDEVTAAELHDLIDADHYDQAMELIAKSIKKEPGK